MITSTTVRRYALVAGVLGSALVLPACGGSSASTSGASASASPAVSADAALAAKVPDAVKKDGKITVGVDSTYPPAESLAADGKTVEGFDVEIFDAVAAKLGLKTDWVSADFGAIITGVSSGKYETGVSSFTINGDRKNQANMVSYFTVGTQWATAKGNPAKVAPDDACGKKIAVQKDTVQVDDITARSAKCTGAGKAAIGIDPYTKQTDATAAVASGKDDAMLADYPVAVYAGEQSAGKIALLGEQYEAAPYGFVIAKDQTDFAQAVADATKAIIADGTYGKILQKYKLTQGAITNPTVNP